MAKRKKKAKRKASRRTHGKRLAASAAATHRARHTRKKRAKKRRSGLMPLDVIERHAKTLKRNKRAAAVYRKVLSV